LRLGLHLNADNFDELERIDDWIARNGPTHAVVGLRINPMVGAGRIATTSVGHAVSKFGVPISERAAIVEAARRWPWLSALHIHVGSQGCGLALLVEGVAKLIDLVHAIEDATEVNRITHLDIGGGLPVAYRSDEQPPSLEDYIEALRTEVPELLSGRFRLLTEFGRGIQANCGFAVSRVEYVKHVHGVQMAVVHLGADMFLRPVYHPKDWTHMFAVFDPQGRPKTGPKQAWTIVGPLCFGGDVIGRDRALPAIEAGDLLLIRDTGAYTLSMWSMHCSRGQPPVVGFDTDQLKVIRESQSPQGLVDYWGPHPRG
ncbi:MAG: diaminopimelate decarboxylase, partial [Myxococcota bacterium]